MGAIEELIQAAQKFESALATCDRVLSLLPEIDDRDRHALGAIGVDIVDTCVFVLPQAARSSIEATKAEIADLMAGKFPTEDVPELGPGIKVGRLSGGRARSENAPFRLAMKSSYFLIRSFQDAVYRLGHHVLVGRKAKKESSASMSRALRDEDPVRVMLGEFADEYLAWFKGWRVIRDRIKMGQGASYLGSFVPGAPPDDIGINLVRVTDEGGIETDLSKGTRISDIARALSVTTKLISLLSDAARTGVDQPEAGLNSSGVGPS